MSAKQRNATVRTLPIIPVLGPRILLLQAHPGSRG